MAKDHAGDSTGQTVPSIGRRAVLRAGVMSAAAAGAVAAFPGALAGLVTAGPEASAAAPELEGMAGEELSAPIVAHITDAASGQVSLYVGEREVVYRDAQLVQRLLRATR